MTDGEHAASYEALFQELMQKPIPREGFVLSKRPLDLLRRGDVDVDPYERWLAGQSKATRPW